MLSSIYGGLGFTGAVRKRGRSHAWLVGLVAAAFLAVLTSGSVLAHQDRQGNEGLRLEVSPSEAVLGQVVLIRGMDFAPTQRAEVFGVPDLEADGTCPQFYDPGSGHMRVEGDGVGIYAGDDGTFEVRLEILGSEFVDTTLWGFCGVSGDGQVTESPGVLEITRGLWLEGDLEGNRVFPGETVTFRGGGFAPLQSVRVYGIPGRGPDGHDAPDCETDLDFSERTVRGTANAAGDLRDLEFRLEGEVFLSTLQWFFCAQDGTGEVTKQPYHLHIVRLLRTAVYNRAITPGVSPLVGRGILSTSSRQRNVVSIVPRIDEGARITGLALGNRELDISGVVFNRGRQETTFELVLPPGTSPGFYTLFVKSDRPLGGAFVGGEYDPNALSGVFEVVGRAAGGGRLVGDARVSHPGGTMTFTGRGFTPGRGVIIYAVLDDNRWDGRVCPNYDPSVHTLSVRGSVDGTGALEETAFRLSDPGFRRLGRWGFCGVDTNNVKVEIPWLIVMTHGLLAAGRDLNILVYNQDNRVLIVPSLPDGVRVTGWRLGGNLQSVTGSSGYQKGSDGTDSIVVRPLVEPGQVTEEGFVPGRYTLEVTLSDGRRLHGVFDVALAALGSGEAMLSSPSVTGRPGETLLISGSGFEPGRTVIVYAVPESSSSWDGLGTPSCPDYAPALHVNTVSSETGDDGVMVEVEFPLDDEAFSREWSWHFCAVDGSGRQTPDALVIRIRRTLLFGSGDEAILLAKRDNVVRISPALPEGDTVVGVRLGPFELTPPDSLERDDISTGFIVNPDVPEGVYTLFVETSLDGGDQELRAEVIVAGGSHVAGDFYVTSVTDTASVGDTVVFLGEGFAESQTARVYGVLQGEDGGASCEPPTGTGPVGEAQTGSDGGFTVSLDFMPEDIFAAGVWLFCGVDGAGYVTPYPHLVTVVPALFASRGHLVRHKENTVSVVPALPEGSVLESVDLGGVPHVVDGFAVSDGVLTDFLLVTAQQPGTYTLVVTVEEMDPIEAVMDVVPQPDPPILQLGSDTGSFGDVLYFAGTGFLGGSQVTIMGRPLQPAGAPDDGDWGGNLPQELLDAISEGSSGEDVCASMLDGVVFSDSEGEAGDDGVLLRAVPVVIESFSQAGDWIFCAVDDDQNLTAEPVEVRLVPGMVVSDDGRVRAGQSVDIQLVPDPGLDTEVSDLRLGRRRQEAEYGSGVVKWVQVPEIMGDHILYLQVGDDRIAAEVTILSGRRPDDKIPSGAMECPGMTEVLDGRVPGGKSAMSFTFRILEDDTIACRLRQVSLERSQGGVFTESATTKMPEDDFTIELNQAYELPASPRTEIHVSSYDTRFGYRYRAQGIRFLRSEGGGENHRIVMPSCTAWVDLQGDSAPCEIEYAKEIKVTFQSALTLPRDASADYATQVLYNDGALWDVVNFSADLDVLEDRVPFNQSITVNGLGYGEGELVRIFGVNLSRDDLFVIPEEEEAVEWDCRLVVQYGQELGDAVSGEDNSFSVVLLVTDTTFKLPGRWQLCATTGPGGTSGEPAPVVIDYEARPQAGERYYAGGSSYIRVVPVPPEGGEAMGLRVAGEDVGIEVAGDEVRFVMPVNVSGSTRAVLDFPDDLMAEIYLEALSPTLSIDVVEQDNLVRIGTLLRMTADNLSGERVCNPTIDDVEVAFLVDGRVTSDNCAVVGANRRFRADVLIVGPDRRASAELVRLFDEKSKVEFVAESEDGARVTASLNLLVPVIEVKDGDGGDIKGKVLLQFKALRVSGRNFPREGPYHSAPQVGYEVRDHGHWDTRTSDGTWEDEFRITHGVSEGARLEFVPIIGGHRMPNRAFVLEVGIQTPTLSIEPGEVRTGEVVTITGANLLGFVGGYHFGIVHPFGDFILSDYSDGEAVFVATDAEGAFSVSFEFPEYEAEFYDQNGKALLKVQLFNSAKEAIPEAFTDVTHVLVTPASRLDGGVATAPTPTPLPAAVPTPTPGAVVGRVPVVTPTPVSPGSGFSRTVERGLPRGVNHRRMTVDVGHDGRSVSLHWERPVGLYRPAGYLVMRSTGAEDDGMELANLEGMDNTSYVDGDVVPAASYWYWVVAYNAEGQAEDDGSGRVMVMTPSPPGPVVGFGHEEPGSTLLTLKWDGTADDGIYRPVLGYELQSAGVDEDEWSVVARVGDYVRSWVVIDLVPGSVSRYRMAAYNGISYGPWTEPLAVEQESVVEFVVLPAIEATKEAPEVVVPLQPVDTGRGPFGGVPGGWLTVVVAGLMVLVAGWFLWRMRSGRRLAGVDGDGEDDERVLGEEGGLAEPWAFDREPPTRRGRGGWESSDGPASGDVVGDDDDDDDAGDEDPEALRRRLADLLDITYERPSIEVVPGRGGGDFDLADAGPLDPDEDLRDLDRDYGVDEGRVAPGFEPLRGDEESGPGAGGGGGGDVPPAGDSGRG